MPIKLRLKLSNAASTTDDEVKAAAVSMVPSAAPPPPPSSSAPLPAITTYHWLQCENPLCNKWRRIPTTAFLPASPASSSTLSVITSLFPLTFNDFSQLQFHCCDNPDPANAACFIEEEVMEQGEAEWETVQTA